MKDNELRFSIKDLIVVSVPSSVGLLAKNDASIKECDKKIGVPQGKIFELAILNKEKNRFILVRDFEKRIIRQVKDYVTLNNVGEYQFQKLNVFGATFQRINQEPCNKIVFGASTFEVPVEQVENGIAYQNLVFANNKFISSQLKNFVEEFYVELEKHKKQEYLKKCQEQYLNF